MPAMDPVTIREALAGYAAANEVIETERQAILAHMTHEMALATWRDIMESFNRHPAIHQNLDRLDLWQVEGLLAIRRALDLMATATQAL